MCHRSAPDARSGPDQHAALNVLSHLYRLRCLRIRFGCAWGSASRTHRCPVSQLVLGQLGKWVAVMTTKKQGQRDQRPQAPELRCHSAVRDLATIIAATQICLEPSALPAAVGPEVVIGVAPDGDRTGVVTGLLRWLLARPGDPPVAIYPVDIRETNSVSLRGLAGCSLVRDLLIQPLCPNTAASITARLWLLPPETRARYQIPHWSIRKWSAQLGVTRGRLWSAIQAAQQGGADGV